MEISIYGGIKQIGGNKVIISLPDGPRLLFDFGLSFDDKENFYGNYLQPRKFNGLLDYLYLGLLPVINGLYRNDVISVSENLFREVLDKYGLCRSDTPYINAFFLTHAHMDHNYFAGLLRKDIPFYMTPYSAVMIYYTDRISIGSGPEGDILNFYEMHKLVPKKRGGGMKRARKKDYPPDEIFRCLNPVFPYVPINIKTQKHEIEVIPCPVDHSIAGAVAYIIKYDGVGILYTGDYRFHGLNPDFMEKFVDMIRKHNVYTVITEGTNLSETKKEEGFGEENNEDDVKKKASEHIKYHDGLVLVNFPIKNPDRFRIFYEIACETDRILVLNTKAYLMLKIFSDMKKESFWKNFIHDDDIIEQILDYLNSEEHYRLPEPDDPNIGVYLRRKGWGVFEPEDYISYEKEIYSSNVYLTYNDIHNEQSEYIMYLDFYMLNELIDINPDPEKVVYLYSQTDPFNKEMELTDEKLNRWMSHFGIKRTETVHSSGHAYSGDLLGFLSEISPEHIIPIHTKNPELFGIQGNGSVLYPVPGRKIIV